MTRPYLMLALLFGASTALCGCRQAPWPHLSGMAPRPATGTALTGEDPDLAAGASVPRSGSNLSAAPTVPQAATAFDSPQPAAAPPQGDLAAVMNELQSLGAIDPAQQNQLLEDLKKSDPKYWPMITQSFRAALNRQRGDAGTADTAVAPPRTGSPALLASATVAPTGTALPASLATAPQPLPAPTIAPAQPATAAAVPEPLPQPPSMPIAPAQTVREEFGPPPPVDSTASAMASPGATGDSNAMMAARVGATSPTIAPAADSRTQIDTAIRSLENELATASPGSASTSARRELQLRMMYLLADRRQDALRPIDGLPAAEQEYWSGQLYALATFLDEKREADASRRAATAVEHLRNASARLAELGVLEVKNLAFCTEVSSYGVFKKFPDTKFAPGQEVLLYAELENFKSEQTPKGWHTALRSSYQVLDDQGRVVDEHQFDLTEEYCANARRDFFIRYFLYLPERINPGSYTLQLTIEDTLSRKIGQSSIPVTIAAH
ncbi:MAG: hypothetical protein K1X74_04115 [Pirellulales bacterium]|nr:hypothetical protein [Pirellulales bacterium]